MLEKSDLVSTLYSPEVDYIMLYPSNAQMAYNGITWDESKGSLVMGTGSLSSSAQQKYVYAHVASIDGSTTTLTELPMTGKHVFRTLSPDYRLYWYMKDGKITNSFLHNQLISYTGNSTTEADIYCDVEELKFRGESWSNGHCYAYDVSRSQKLFEGSLSNALYAKFVPMMYGLRNDETTIFNAYIQLLIKAGMINEDSQDIPYMTESCLMLVPTNEAVKQAIVGGKIPGITTTASADASTADFFAAVTVTDEATLQRYLKSYFVPLSTAVFSNYPFLGWGEDTQSAGGLITLNSTYSIVDGAEVEVVMHLNIFDDGTKLSAQMVESGFESGSSAGYVDFNGKVDFVGDYDYFPFVFDDGCVQFINGVL